MSLIAELKRRSVFKVGAAYLVVAWLVIQAASIAFPTFEAPAWALRVFIFVVLLGFPVALVLAWTLEVTPDGVKLDKAPVGNARMYAIVGALALLAVGWYFKGMPAWREDPAATAAAPDARGSGAGSPAADGVRRLAVLPLANFSPDPDNAFFADGLHDDMLTALSRLKGVEVISRTTMQTFKGSTKKLAEIADEISATHVLEGSVRRDAKRVRLTVQLIDPRTDGHIWAETYDRPLDDSLDLQTAVAKEVAAALKVAIDASGGGSAPTANSAAYDLFLKARLANTQNERGDALELFDAALLVDPGFALARAMRATAACNIVWWDDLERKTLAPKALADIAQVRREAPDLLELGLAESTCTYYLDRDYPKALARIEEVLARAPDHAFALDTRAILLRRLGRFDESLVSHARSIALDPNNLVAQGAYTQTLASLKRYRDAIAAVDAALVRMPGQWRLEQERGRQLYFLTGDIAHLRGALERVAGRMPEDQRRDALLFRAGPSPERLASNVARSTELRRTWGGLVTPWALDAAWDADQLGDAVLSQRMAAQAETLMAAFDPERLARDRTRALRAQVYALLGRPADAIAEAEAALVAAERHGDPLAAGAARYSAALALARAGARSRALDLLEQHVAAPFRMVMPAEVKDDPTLRRLLGADPRYQALIRTIEAEFERP